MFKKNHDKADRSPILKSRLSLQLYNAFSLDQILQKESSPYTLRYSDTDSLNFLSYFYLNLHGFWRPVSPFNVTTLSLT